MKRPLTPAPRATPDERTSQRRFTWRMLILGVVTNFVGCGVHYMFSPPRLGGAMPAPRVPTVATPDETLHEVPGALAPERKLSPRARVR